MPSTKKSVIRHMYEDLVGDASASSNLSESKIDESVAALVDLEEPDLMYDLHVQWHSQDLKERGAKTFVRKARAKYLATPP